MTTTEPNPFPYEEVQPSFSDITGALTTFVESCYSKTPHFTYADRVQALTAFYGTVALEYPGSPIRESLRDPALLAVDPIVSAMDLDVYDQLKLLSHLAEAMDTGNPDNPRFPVDRIRAYLLEMVERQRNDGDDRKVNRINGILARLTPKGRPEKTARAARFVAAYVYSIFDRP